uniref:Uncharacterized protein n=1 Tax=Rhizophora mucronata TaxID=61149 RepID=A0A2P2NUV5_RHIMU
MYYMSTPAIRCTVLLYLAQETGKRGKGWRKLNDLIWIYCFCMLIFIFGYLQLK